ncbi:MAG TPA: GIY-YIG nuclease family protein [Segetibacter sp.]|jgi:putative endonuclease
MQRGGSVYIMTNIHNEVLYTGVTSDLITRVQQHKNGTFEKSFTKAYHVDKLVYYNSYLNIEEVIAEEKRIKGGSRAKKTRLIESVNPEWKDLWEEVSEW